ncbi:hypothetical protein [uncultured Mediterranean phage uvMED]|nr:hypothetical protein [uncultured Mediterranean phage uvMED]
MAHYAKLGINSKVIAVHVVADSDCQNADGVEDEEVGRQFLERIHSWPLWKKTSYNTAGGQHKNGGTPLRGNYAGIGMTYDEDNDIFIGKKPYASWTLNVAEARWQSPAGDAPALTAEQTSQNEAGTHRWSYNWNESGQSWDIENSLA